MALRSEYVDFLADKISEELVEAGLIELPEGFSIKQAVFEALDDEVMLENRLNDEVRTVLDGYSNQMRETGASYQEMFKLIKKKLVRERKLVL